MEPDDYEERERARLAAYAPHDRTRLERNREQVEQLERERITRQEQDNQDRVALTNQALVEPDESPAVPSVYKWLCDTAASHSITYDITDLIPNSVRMVEDSFSTAGEGGSRQIAVGDMFASIEVSPGSGTYQTGTIHNVSV